MQRPRIVTDSRKSVPWRYLMPGCLLLFIAGVAGFLTAGSMSQDDGGAGARYREALEAAQQHEAGLRQELAISQRSAQVTGAANETLREEIENLEEQIAGLEADVAFYRRLLGSGGTGKGLAVHALRLDATASAAVYRYQLTLSQNLDQAKIVTGRYGLEAEGLLDGEMVRLDGERLSLRPRAGDYRFEFKYFQELRGTLRFPEDFIPEALVVRLQPEEADAPIVRHFNWAEIDSPEQLGDANGDVQSEG